MTAGSDFQDQTPPPTPTPKKHYHYPPIDADGVIPWPAGQTFQQALGAALPPVIRQKTNQTDFTIRLDIDANEV